MPKQCIIAGTIKQVITDTVMIIKELDNHVLNLRYDDNNKEWIFIFIYKPHRQLNYQYTKLAIT